ncbi:DUF221-domain-containing protein [Tilletiaria anomala UBC 951]|uniref:DUF221-domain-containing protein n=1 Tax=Tilletiaria anomala (strain ATCC 24038 / CBS 436.72 / UBC 951) TaxID=1037660 RepID=A0A066WJW4_TILAU|nr:DUF221-domain-containing protein [Tilletiaria anomala UBC 951]KDN52828.1 DUF221-domain-containing protein [Tilletiaria anomala UBC 951]
MAMVCVTVAALLTSPSAALHTDKGLYATLSTSLAFKNDHDPPSGPEPAPSPTSITEPIAPNDPRRAYIGPWFQQQVALSFLIGLLSLVLFSFLRRKYIALYAPRTKITGLFSPSVEAYTASHDDLELKHLFAWILPTLKIKEVDFIQNLGIDAIVLLDFLKMGFWLFFFLSVWAAAVLMPINWMQNGSIDGVAPSEEQDSGGDNETEKTTNWVFPASLQMTLLPNGGGPLDAPIDPIPRVPSVPSVPPQATLYHFMHFLSTLLISILAIRAIYRNYMRYVKCRQLYALQILESIPARTVMLRHLPMHLKEERKLAEYFEDMGHPVESVSLVHAVKGLGRLLDERAQALYKLEKAWSKFLGNPTPAKAYDPGAIHQAIQRMAQQEEDEGERVHARRDLPVGAAGAPDVERAPLLIPADVDDPTRRIQLPSAKPRPTMRTSSWNPFSTHVDALDELARRFHCKDREVTKYRTDSLTSSIVTGVGFVTFQSAESAQILAQSVHYPLPGLCITTLAPEPRDIIWSNVAMPAGERRTRQVLVSAFVLLVLIFYIPPLTALASFLKPEAIRKYAPWLYKLLSAEPRLEALVLNFLPSIVLIAFNALLPIMFEWTAYFQGLRARSLVEYSVFKKYYLFLLVSVVFIFLITSTAWEVITQLANNPMSLLEKLSGALPSARKFSLSYVVLQSLGIVPLQMLQLPIVFLRSFQRIWTHTPREHAELNAPPQLYIGTVYPQALIVFTMSILYSIVSPAILCFGCLYFASCYVVYKYKILFVYYKSYESKGEAWPLCASRCMWSLVLFQIFQLSLFVVRKQALLAILVVPLITTTVYMEGYLARTFAPLSENVNLSSIAEANHPAGHEATASAPNEASWNIGTSADGQLANKANLQDDDTLFVAASDRHTDYREPPSQGTYFPGVLNTGRRRYGHPAQTGVLPELWLPIPEEADANEPEPEEEYMRTSAALEHARTTSSASCKQDPIVLSLRNRKPSLLSRHRSNPIPRRHTSLARGGSGIGHANGAGPASPPPVQAPSITQYPSGRGTPEAPNIWTDGISGSQGTSGVAAVGEALTGPEAVAPARLLSANVYYGAHGREGAGGDDDEQEQFEGVYMHRAPSSIRERPLRRHAS